jgi:hypothetical protein
MQLTIEIPERLGQRLEPEHRHLAEILELGLRLRQWANESALAQEVIGFLARGPRPEEIVSFRPSEAAVERSRELRRRNNEGSLTRTQRAQRAWPALRFWRSLWPSVASWVSIVVSD